MDIASASVFFFLRPGFVFVGMGFLAGGGGGDGAPSSFSAASSRLGIEDCGGSSDFSGGMGCGVLRMLS